MKDSKSPYYYIKKIDFLIVKYYDCFNQYFGYDYEDVVQELTIAYTRAYNTYDPNKGAKFETYVIGCLKNHLLDMYKATRRKKRARMIGFDSLFSDNSMEGDNIIDYVIGEYDDPFESLMLKDQILKNAENLTEEELAVYTLYLETRGSEELVIEYLNIDSQLFSEIMKNITEKLTYEE